MQKQKKGRRPARRATAPAPRVVATTRIKGHLVDAATNKPLYPALIEAWDQTRANFGPLAAVTTDRKGTFTLAIGAGAKAASARTIVLYVFDVKRTKALLPEPMPVRLGTKPAHDVVVKVSHPAISEPPSNDIASVHTRLGLKIPHALTGYFAKKKITTLAELRLKGELATHPDLPVAAGDPAVRMLDSLAALSVMPTDTHTNAALASNGMHNVLDVAGASTAAIQKALKDVPTAPAAAHVRSMAKDQASTLNNLIFAARVQAAFGQRSGLPKGLQDALPLVCSCSDCQTALGPIAYLADLLNYTLQHLRNNGQTITLTFLQNRFHQPFRDLPASCAELNRKVRRVRICIEILRKHLTAPVPAPSPAILEATYRTLLKDIGTSFEEIRQISRRGTPQQRVDLMARIMLPSPVPLDALFKDPNALTGDPTAVTEAWLNQVFGPRDTTLAPLAVAPDPLATVPAQFPELLRWQRRFLWNRWAGEDYAAASPTLDGKPFIDPDVVGRPDLVDVSSNPIPRAQRPDRTRWSVLDFLEDRQYWIDQTAVDLRAGVAGTAPGLPARLTTLLQTLQSPATSFPQVTTTGMVGLTFNALRDLYRGQQAGVNLDSQLQALNITPEEIDALGRVVDLAVVQAPILRSEWDDFNSAIISRLKRFGFFAVWKNEEHQMRVTIDGSALTGLTASPYHFQPRTESLLASDTSWVATPLRSTDADRARWDEVLSARTDQIQNLVTVLQGAVDAAELVELPEILRTLLLAAQPAGVTLSASTKQLTDRYQIDFQEGACAFTTRIAQAIETLQDVLFDVRNGLIDDPALGIDDGDFDGIWQWLGRYPTWKAALQVVLFPETALRPTLRARQSQGFVEFIANLRSGGKLTAASARSAVDVYEQYFVDVCNLADGVCALAPAPGPSGSVFFNYLFARSASGQLYWCYFDLDDEQSFWRRIDIADLDESQGELKLFGTAYQTGASGECHLYFFAKQAGADEDRIVFARTNLRDTAEWSDLKWTSGALEPPPSASMRFEFARVLADSSPSDPITLSVWLSDREAYVRALGVTGLAWAEGPFAQVPATGAWRRLGTGAARNGMDFACSTQQIAPKFILAGDFDGDGLDEIAVIPNLPGTLGNDIWVMKFNAASLMWGHVSPIPGHPFSADIDIGAIDPPARFAVAGDFDGDGVQEIAIAADLSHAGASSNIDDTAFWVRKFNPATKMWDPLGRPPGTSPLPYGVAFVGKTDSVSSFFTRPTCRFACVGDFDGDGRDEIAVASSPVFFFGVPSKLNANTFFVFDLELGAGGDNIWQSLPDLQCEAPVSPDIFNPRLTFSRFAVAAKFRPNDDRAILLVGKQILNSNHDDLDPNSGNDFWVYRYDGNGWQSLQPQLDCANVAIAAKFGVVGDFDGDGTPEVAVAQEAMLPGAAAFGFWIEKMDITGSWAPLSELQYGAQLALFAVAGDFDGDGADELAIVTPDVWTSNIHVYDLNNGQWGLLTATGTNLLTAGGALAGGLQPGQVSGDEFVAAGVAARLLPPDPGTGSQLVALAQPGTDNTARAYAFGTSITGSWSGPCAEPEVKPALVVSRPIFATPNIGTARMLNGLVPGALGSLRRRTNRDYLEEMLFFVPLEIANRLRESGDWQAALDWCRLVYDYGAPVNQRSVAAKLRDDQSLSVGTYQQWLKDALNPHALAETRQYAYLKYTVLLICSNLIDWADAEFTLADAESIPEARELYERALDLLDLQEIHQRTDDCDELLSQLSKTIGAEEVTYAYEAVFREIRSVRDPLQLATLSQTITAIAHGRGPLQTKAAKSLAAVRATLKSQGAAPTRTFEEVRQDASNKLISVARLITADEGRSALIMGLPIARGAGQPGVGSGLPGNIRFTPAPVLTFCIPPDPALEALRRHAELCLSKIRACKNIVGLDLCLDPYGATTVDPTGADAQQPMPYHYSTLIERTKQLVELARQMESSMLQFISSAEQAEYDELKARQDLELTQAGVQLKTLQVVQASNGLVNAGLQRDRAQLQVTHFTQLISNGLTMNEQLQVDNLVVADIHQHATAIGAWIEAAFGVGSYSGAVAASGAAWAENSQFQGLMASFERRDQEWQYEKSLAEQDLRSGQQQMTIAQDQLNVASEEQSIAALQAGQAQTLADFLTNKFLNADLYEWMAGELEQVYRFFLQQATQLARLAELQLAFERQEPPTSIIKADYWERPTADLTPDVGASSTGTNSVRGLTGSARLLRDVYELDQYAFAKNQRKQQLSETFSLAQLDPFAFQNFRQTGRLPFATPMSLFDRRLPGHYVRLIRRVRTSVVALIPPTMGIRASLSSMGPTRVTIGPDVFRTVTIQRDPQLVALTSPVNATGLFDLDVQPELLVPFEGLGVDGQWVFNMPQFANPFDYDAIADVLITIDYTSLYSSDYEDQVLRSMDRRFGADRAFSFHEEFEDAWYDLNNPDLVDAPAQPMTVSFTTRRIDFPPHIDQLAIGQVLLQFVQTPQTKQVVNVTALYYTDSTGQTVPALPGQRSASSNADGLISTRRGAWSALIGGAIDGDLTWTLSLPAALKQRFMSEEITDIFFVISYTGLL